MTKQFEGKSVLVTGAGGGIGRATAVAFAREGANVALIDLSSSGIAETLRLVEAQGARGICLTADISDDKLVADAFHQAIDELGNLDFAVNNAGISQSAAATAEIASDEWNRVLQINVTGTWLCMREELRHMTVRGAGVIINIASFAGVRPLKMQTAYVASKHAVVGLTKNAAIEYADQGIRVNSVAPGGIVTPMMESNLTGLDEAQRTAALAQIAALHPMNRIGDPAEIADAVIFLCSSKAAFITGTCLSVDGGWAAS